MKEVDLILAEDTRVTRKLLSACQIKTPLESCHEHNERYKSGQIVERMAQEDLAHRPGDGCGHARHLRSVGALMVNAVAEAGLRWSQYRALSAFAAALSVSGFEDKEFTFFGFLPRKKSELVEKLKGMAGVTQLAVLHESPTGSSR